MHAALAKQPLSSNLAAELQETKARAITDSGTPNRFYSRPGGNYHTQGHERSMIRAPGALGGWDLIPAGLAVLFLSFSLSFPFRGE